MQNEVNILSPLSSSDFQLNLPSCECALQYGLRSRNVARESNRKINPRLKLPAFYSGSKNFVCTDSDCVSRRGQFQAKGILLQDPRHHWQQPEEADICEVQNWFGQVLQLQVKWDSGGHHTCQVTTRCTSRCRPRMVCISMQNHLRTTGCFTAGWIFSPYALKHWLFQG